MVVDSLCTAQHYDNSIIYEEFCFRDVISHLARSSNQTSQCLRHHTGLCLHPTMNSIKSRLCCGAMLASDGMAVAKGCVRRKVLLRLCESPFRGCVRSRRSTPLRDYKIMIRSDIARQSRRGFESSRSIGHGCRSTDESERLIVHPYEKLNDIPRA
jgi:hypothetical protein